MGHFAIREVVVVSNQVVALGVVVEIEETVPEERPYSTVVVASFLGHFDFVLRELALVAMVVACLVAVEDETCS